MDDGKVYLHVWTGEGPAMDAMVPRCLTVGEAAALISELLGRRGCSLGSAPLRLVLQATGEELPAGRSVGGCDLRDGDTLIAQGTHAVPHR